MAQILVIASRSNHPPGYGNFPNGSAHGYSTLVIPCDSESQASTVLTRLATGPVLLPFEQNGWAFWYGGTFDAIAVIRSNDTLVASTSYGTRMEGQGQVYSLGDNRAVTLATARDVLREDARESMRRLQKFNRSTNISNSS